MALATIGQALVNALSIAIIAAFTVVLICAVIAAIRS